MAQRVPPTEVHWCRCVAAIVCGRCALTHLLATPACAHLAAAGRSDLQQRWPVNHPEYHVLSQHGGATQPSVSHSARAMGVVSGGLARVGAVGGSLALDAEVRASVVRVRAAMLTWARLAAALRPPLLRPSPPGWCWVSCATRTLSAPSATASQYVSVLPSLMARRLSLPHAARKPLHVWRSAALCLRSRKAAWAAQRTSGRWHAAQAHAHAVGFAESAGRRLLDACLCARR